MRLLTLPQLGTTLELFGEDFLIDLLLVWLSAQSLKLEC